MDPKPGDLIEISRSLYQHWAVYIGNGYVVHLGPPNKHPGVGFSSLGILVLDWAVVNKDPLCKVAGNDQYRINNKYDHRYVARPVPEILRDAKSMVGQVMDYGLLTENCEHFVTKLRYGIADSDQVTSGITAGLLGIAGVAAAVFVGHMMTKALREDQ